MKKDKICTISTEVIVQVIQIVLIAAGLFLIIIGLQLPGCTQTPAAPAAKESRQAADIENKWGIQILGIRKTAAGHMLDFRYKVTDANKAAPLFVRASKPYLIDQSSGKSLVVPNMAKVGPLRTSNPPKEGRTYWMFFGNPGLVKPGDKVTVVIGDFKVEDMTVQ